jgi:hypothetical protein
MCDDALETAIRIADEEAEAHKRRAYEAQCTRIHLLKRRKPERLFPKPGEVLNTAVVALTQVTGRTFPTIVDDTSDPDLVFAYIVDAISAYGKECRNEGRREASDALPPRIEPEQVPATLKLMSTLNGLLGAG